MVPQLICLGLSGLFLVVSAVQVWKGIDATVPITITNIWAAASIISGAVS